MGQAGEPVRILLGQLSDVVVALAVHGHRLVHVQIIKVHVGVGGQYVNVHAQGVHVGNPLLGRPEGPWVVPVLVIKLRRGDPEPVFATLHRPQRAGRRYVRVDIENAYCHYRFAPVWPQSAKPWRLPGDGRCGEL